MEFFNNKRLLIVLSGVTCIMIALVVFVISVIGVGNIGAFFGGKPAQTQEPTQTPTPVQTPTPTVPPTQTPDYFVPTTLPLMTAPPTDVPTEAPTETPDGTELPSESPAETPTPPPTEVPVIGVNIVQGESYTLKVGETVQLQASILPSDATNQNLTWDGGTATNIAVVSKDGFVAALSAGEIWVTVRSDNNMFDQIKIVVVPASTPEPTTTPEPTPTPTAPPTEEPVETPIPDGNEENPALVEDHGSEGNA